VDGFIAKLVGSSDKSLSGENIGGLFSYDEIQLKLHSADLFLFYDNNTTPLAVKELDKGKSRLGRYLNGG
jgi:hypothetical protein